MAAEHASSRGGDAERIPVALCVVSALATLMDWLLVQSQLKVENSPMQLGGNGGATHRTSAAAASGTLGCPSLQVCRIWPHASGVFGYFRTCY